MVRLFIIDELFILANDKRSRLDRYGKWCQIFFFVLFFLIWFIMFIAFCYQLVIALSKCSFAANNIPPSSLITVFCAWPFFLFFVFIIPHRVFDQNEWRNVYPFTDPCHWAKKFFLSTLPSFAFYPNWNSDALNDLKKKKKKKNDQRMIWTALIGKDLDDIFHHDTHVFKIYSATDVNQSSLYMLERKQQLLLLFRLRDGEEYKGHI